MSRVLCLIFSLFVACTFTPARFTKSPTGRDVYFHHVPIFVTMSCDMEAVTPAVRRDVIEAILDWNREIGVKIFEYERNCFAGISYPGGVLITYEQDDTSENQNIAGITWMFGSADGEQLTRVVVVLFKSWAENVHRWNRINVVRHELGHALGLVHSSDDSCLMAPAISSYVRDYSDRPKDLCADERRSISERYGQ